VGQRTWRVRIDREDQRFRQRANSTSWTGSYHRAPAQPFAPCAPPKVKRCLAWPHRQTLTCSTPAGALRAAQRQRSYSVNSSGQPDAGTADGQRISRPRRNFSTTGTDGPESQRRECSTLRRASSWHHIFFPKSFGSMDRSIARVNSMR
jgi:hypothetical protein